MTFSELVMESMVKTVSNSGSKAVDSTSALTQNPDSGQDKEQDSNLTDGDDSESQDMLSRIWVQTDFWEYVDLLLVDIRVQIQQEELMLEGHKKKLEA